VSVLAALEVATGKVVDACYPRLIHKDCLAFLKQVTKAYPRRNLLVGTGGLAAVLDWGMRALGDPAVDCLAAWSLLDATTRPAFRNRVGVDDATWERGRGWALSIALVAQPYYVHTNRQITAWALHASCADRRRDSRLTARGTAPRKSGVPHTTVCGIAPAVCRNPGVDRSAVWRGFVSARWQGRPAPAHSPLTTGTSWLPLAPLMNTWASLGTT